MIRPLWLGQYFEAIKDDDGDDDYSGKVKTPKKTPKKSKAATPKRGKGGKVEKRGRPAAKAESPAKKTPAKKSKSPAKKAKTPKKETPKKAPAKKEPPKPGIKIEFHEVCDNTASRCTIEANNSALIDYNL